ncbi:right-handed parallel beta-helix repeat-containing protein [Segatella hominis]|uniref:right-handed parallel beta-helix repeat-containing protein n=1 Tax=Segatella hominis TaxID=2518605 RepID=UPI001C45BF6B|nr:right-handed parallel beta-helix repeat-containing protein [Segatella hominis]WOZ82468.1 right-handed parallel beta-helix repeat-containing protein [Segatella hominis]
MKKINTFACMLMMAAAAMFSTSCENDNINPYDYTNHGGNGSNENQGSNEVLKTDVAEYPVGSLVWSKDTTLSESVEIPVGTSLYIEPGVTVTCKSEVQVPVEIVVLGNLYCMGTAEKPVTFTSDTKKPADWGGIICGYNSEEVVLNHVEVANAGATPTESSASFQNKLFKTTIDGGVPAFHFCNVNGKFVMANCFFHGNYNDQTYFTGGNGVIINNIFADSGNAADGGEAINVKAGCKLDVANNIIYNACTNAFKLSNAGNSETIPLTEMTVYNNTIVDCGWRRAKNKKGGSVWVEKAAKPIFVNNLIYDSRYGLKQPKQDGADMEHSRLTPNYYFASTDKGVEQMAKGASLSIWYDTDIKSSVAGQLNPLFKNFKQSDKMNINCEIDLQEKGAPLAFDKTWNFEYQDNSPALSGGVTDFSPLFPNGLPFFGLKKVNFLDTKNDMNYYFSAPLPRARFGAWR